MRIQTLRLIEGAKQAEGLTVIIDVFRAFSLECYLYDMGVKEIRPVGTVEKRRGAHCASNGSLFVPLVWMRTADGRPYSLHFFTAKGNPVVSERFRQGCA